MPEPLPADHPAAQPAYDRPLRAAMLRGARCRCPACGKGKLFTGYLKVVDNCPVCGEELHHHRADDGPAYLTILLVTHIGAPLLLLVFMLYRPSPISLLLWFSGGAIVLSLALLPVIKGMFVGFQWSRRMHGFEDRATDEESSDTALAN